jgi:hypothetical protein
MLKQILIVLAILAIVIAIGGWLLIRGALDHPMVK